MSELTTIPRAAVAVAVGAVALAASGAAGDAAAAQAPREYRGLVTTVVPTAAEARYDLRVGQRGYYRRSPSGFREDWEGSYRRAHSYLELDVMIYRTAAHARAHFDSRFLCSGCTPAAVGVPGAMAAGRDYPGCRLLVSVRGNVWVWTLACGTGGSYVAADANADALRVHRLVQRKATRLAAQ
jgi:hypothetical protein